MSKLGLETRHLINDDDMMHEPECMLHACCMHEPPCMDRHAWTGMHATAAAAAAAACMRACARGCLRDRHHVSADLQFGADLGVENRISV
jgi:hypothetical protein